MDFNEVMKMEFETLCLHANLDKRNGYGAVTTPIYQSATFVHGSVDEVSEYSYSRLSNPTRTHLEKTVAALEHGTAAFAFSSGMAAISTVMKLFSISDHIIASEDLYGGSLRIVPQCQYSRGNEFRFCQHRRC